MEACKAESRVFLPKLDEFFANAIDQADPEAMVEEQYKDINQQNFQWKAYRLLARSSPHFFVHTNTPGLPITVHLKEIVDKMAKDINPNLATTEIKTEVAVANDDDEIKDNQDDQDVDDMRNADEEDGNPQLQLTKEHIHSIARQAGSLWMKLGERLGMPSDHLAYFKDTSENVVDIAVAMLTVWQEEDPEGDSIAAIRDALTDLGLTKVLTSLNLP
jgi:THO complex subunit 1